jgi:serine protease Do
MKIDRLSRAWFPNWFVYCLGIASLWLALSSMSLGQDESLDALIAGAQQKMVKIFGATAGRVEGYGTGVLVSNNGLIVTAQGVYLDGPQVRVILADGTEHVATILRRDRMVQLALLKIDCESPSYFDLSTDPGSQKGDWILAISNAFKVADQDEPLSVTMGNIGLQSSIDARLNQRDVAYRGDIVLLDAITSNPGAAGGAVINLEGKLVGTIGKIINSSETNTRLNYAVPAKIIAAFVAGTYKSDDQATVQAAPAKPADLGIKLFSLAGRKNPAYIDRVVPNGPADKVGLTTDDLIITIAGEKVGTIIEYEAAVSKLFPGEEVLMVVKRGSKILQVPITPEEKK